MLNSPPRELYLMRLALFVVSRSFVITVSHVHITVSHVHACLGSLVFFQGPNLATSGLDQQG
jgi:hypothetical protein